MGVVDISLHNKFDEPTDILRIEFPAYGKCFSFQWNSTSPGKLIIDANQTYRVRIEHRIVRCIFCFICLDW
jgi:hypothetical protein